MQINNSLLEGLDLVVEEIYADIEDHLHKSRGNKYNKTLFGLKYSYVAFAVNSVLTALKTPKSFKKYEETKPKFSFRGFIPQVFTKKDLLRNHYFLMREIDDIVDGDKALPEGYALVLEYVDQRIDFYEQLQNGKSPDPIESADYLMIRSVELADKLGYDISLPTMHALESMRFDAKRRGTGYIPTQKELDKHFNLQDILGTATGLLMLFDHYSPELYQALIPIGTAHRDSLTIEDLQSDLAKGIVNFSQEDCLKYGLTNEDVNTLIEGKQANPEKYTSAHSKLQIWIEDKSIQGLALISEHNKLKKEYGFPITPLFMIKLFYENNAKSTLEKALNPVPV